MPEAQKSPLAQAEIDCLVTLTERLADAIEAECQVLSERRLTGLKPLVEAKLPVVNAYDTQLARMGGAALVAADPLARSLLREPTRRLREIMALHTIQVAAARTVADRLMRSIAESVAQQARPVLGYGPRAALRTATAAPAAMAVSAEA